MANTPHRYIYVPYEATIVVTVQIQFWLIERDNYGYLLCAFFKFRINVISRFIKPSISWTNFYFPWRFRGIHWHFLSVKFEIVFDVNAYMYDFSCFSWASHTLACFPQPLRQFYTQNPCTHETKQVLRQRVEEEYRRWKCEYLSLKFCP